MTQTMHTLAGICVTVAELSDARSMQQAGMESADEGGMAWTHGNAKAVRHVVLPLHVQANPFQGPSATAGSTVSPPLSPGPVTCRTGFQPAAFYGRLDIILDSDSFRCSHSTANIAQAVPARLQVCTFVRTRGWSAGMPKCSTLA